MNDPGKRWSVYDRDGNLIYLTQSAGSISLLSTLNWRLPSCI